MGRAANSLTSGINFGSYRINVDVWATEQQREQQAQYDDRDQIIYQIGNQPTSKTSWRAKARQSSGMSIVFCLFGFSKKGRSLVLAIGSWFFKLRR